MQEQEREDKKNKTKQKQKQNKKPKGKGKLCEFTKPNKLGFIKTLSFPFVLG